MTEALKSETNVPVGGKRTQVWQRSLRQGGRPGVRGSLCCSLESVKPDAVTDLAERVVAAIKTADSACQSVGA
jgi:hypothetical protein